MPSDLIPPGVHVALQNAMGGWGPYTVREIEDKFASFGFKPPASLTGDRAPGSERGQRRTTVSMFQEGIDWSAYGQCERYLELVKEVIEDLDEGAGTRSDLLRALKRAGIELDGAGRYTLRRTPLAVVSVPATEDGIRFHLDRLERLDAEPEELVGAAKELIEATCRYVLNERAKSPDRGAKVPSLVKQVSPCRTCSAPRCSRTHGRGGRHYKAHVGRLESDRAWDQ